MAKDYNANFSYMKPGDRYYLNNPDNYSHGVGLEIIKVDADDFLATVQQDNECCWNRWPRYCLVKTIEELSEPPRKLSKNEWNPPKHLRKLLKRPV